MAVVAAVPDPEKKYSVNTDGLVLTPAKPIRSLEIRAEPDNTAALAYELNGEDLLEVALADDAGVKAAGVLYLEPGDSRKIQPANVNKITFKSPTGATNSVRVKTV